MLIVNPNNEGTPLRTKEEIEAFLGLQRLKN